MNASKAVFVLFAALMVQTPAFADEASCSDPSLRLALGKIADRQFQVDHAKELNARLLKDRKASLTGAKLFSYSARGIVIAGGTVVGLGAGAYLGALAQAASVPLHTVVTEGVVTQIFASGGVGAAAGAVAGGWGARSLITPESGGLNGPEGVTRTADEGTAALDGLRPLSSNAILSGLDQLMGQFRDAQKEIGAAAMRDEAIIQDDSAWYHLGYDGVKTIQVMVEENRSHYELYVLEEGFLKQARAEIAAACTAAALRASQADAGPRAYTGNAAGKKSDAIAPAVSLRSKQVGGAI
jgi:hypothetical protein